MAAITEEDIRFFKLYRILETAGQQVLTYTLHCGTPGRPSTATLLDYLNNLPQHSTANYTREKSKFKSFSRTDRDEINRDPTCKTFSLTLLYKVIQLACESVAGLNEMVNNVSVWHSPTPLPDRELEHFVAKINDTRNAVVHERVPLSETAFLNEVATLRALFDSCLRATKDRYARDEGEYQVERTAVQDKVTEILQETLLIDKPGMSLQSADVSMDDLRYMKLHYIMSTVGQRVLTYTLLCGTAGKPSTVTFLDYLNSLPQNSTANYMRMKNKSKCFNKTEKDLINRDPTCTTFDITLLFRSIKLGCENVADVNEMVNNVNVWASPTPLPGRELEYFTKEINKSRNSLVHEYQPLSEAAFQNKVATLHAIFDSCLRATRDRYARGEAEYLAMRDEVQAKVAAIQQETPRGVEEMQGSSATSMLPDSKQEIYQELRAGVDIALIHAVRSSVGSLFDPAARASRQAAVDRVLDIIREVALKWLLQDRLSHSDQDLQDADAMLSALLSMRKGAKELRETLVHLLSLLTGQGDATQGAVEMLLQSGVTSINQWLDLLTDAMASDDTVHHAAEKLVAGGLNDNEEIWVRNENARVASVMLQHLPPWKVEVHLEQELGDMDNLARALARHKVTKLRLQHHWRHPHQYGASATLLRDTQGGRRYLQEFRGHLDAEDLTLLQQGLTSLSLVVRNSQHTQTLLHTLTETNHSFPDLKDIILHIPAAAATPTAVTCLPTGPVLDLYLSGVTSQLAEAAGGFVAAVCPPKQGLAELAFPEATLDLTGWKDLISRLEWARVRVRGGVYVPDTHISEEEGLDLHTFTTTRLGCDRVDRIPSEDMWMWS